MSFNNISIFYLHAFLGTKNQIRTKKEQNRAEQSRQTRRGKRKGILDDEGAAGT